MGGIVRPVPKIHTHLLRQLWRLRTVIGLAVSGRRIRAIAVRHGKALWCLEVERAPDVPLSAQVQEVLRASRAARRRPRPPVVLAVPPRHAQVKNLENLPPAADRLLEAVVRESAGRYFRKNGVPLLIGGIERSASGVWAAAYERPFLMEIADGCARAGFRLHGACPSVIAAARASLDSLVPWRDEENEYELVKASDGSLLKIRSRLRESASLDRGASPHVDHGLAPLGRDAWRFADAFGAANGASRESLAIRPSAAEELSTRRRTRIAAAAIACLATWSALAAARLISSKTQAAAAKSELARLSPTRQAYGSAVVDLARATHQLDALARFDAQRGQITIMLSELAAALPSGSAITALQVDSTGGTVVGIAPNASSLVDAFGHVPSITSVEILGPIGRETLPANSANVSNVARATSPDVDRVTVRFRLVRRNRSR